jgi:hypothetical protein
MNERILHIERTETLVDLSEKIQETKADNIVFVIPRKAEIFSSALNFQKLRDVAEEEEKTISIVTQDSHAREMIETIGVSVYKTLEDREKTPFECLETGESISLHRVRKVPIEKGNRGDPILESQTEQHWKHFFSRPSRQSFFFLLLLSFVLFFFIALLALPSATIIIQPEKSVRDAFINITLLSKEKYSEEQVQKEEAIFSLPIEEIFSKKIIVPSTGIEYEKLRIINSLEREFQFSAKTRFQSPNGSIYRSKTKVTVPEKKGEENGQVEVEVELDPTARKEQKTATIPYGAFFLPGLSGDSLNNVWAEAIKEEALIRITSEDIENAKQKLEKEVLDSAIEKITHFLEVKNKEEGMEWAFLPEEGKQFQKELMEIVVLPPDALGARLENFSIEAKIRVRNVAFSKKDIIEILKDKFGRDVQDGMELAKIDDNFSIEILSIQEGGDKIKMNFSTRVEERYIIEPKTIEGLSLVNKIKNEVLGLRLRDAEKKILNNPQIASVEIILRPFWVRSLPTLPENISLSIVNESE